MRVLLQIFMLLIVVQQLVAPPVTQEKKEDEEKHEQDPDLEQMEYHRYLKEVVQVLESDPEFRDKLEKAKEADIRSGKIARELELANHHVRSKLDEIKRSELERLKHLYQELGWTNGLDKDHMEIAEHVDRHNPHTFEVDDLKKLIAKTTKDLDELDRQRKKQFKEYEMQKKFEQEELLKGNTGMSPEDRKKYESNLHATEEKHKKHERIHHPGSKQQLEEVWEKKDHLGDQNFDPRTFFLLHDLDGNGAWDQDEVKALFSSELDKLYATGSPNQGDLRERAEEMERMREHVFKEADHNKDGFISFQEFLAETKKPGFQKDEGWESLDEQQIYTQQEYEAFQKQREEEIKRLIDQGVIPPYPDHMNPPHYQGHPAGHGGAPVPNYGHHADPNGQYQQYPQQGHPQYHQGQPPAQYHPGQGHPNEINQGQGYPNQMHPGQNHPNQVYPDQHHPNQVQPGQVHPNQMHPNQIHPDQGHPNQMQPGQVHPNQIHPDQGHPNQIHQGQIDPNAIPNQHHGQGLPHESQSQYYQQGHQQPHVQELPHQSQPQVQNQQEHPQVSVQNSQQQPNSNQANHNQEKQQQNIANNIPVAHKS